MVRVDYRSQLVVLLFQGIHFHAVVTIFLEIFTR
jgi:hypothetical protein